MWIVIIRYMFTVISAGAEGSWTPGNEMILLWSWAISNILFPAHNKLRYLGWNPALGNGHIIVIHVLHKTDD